MDKIDAFKLTSKQKNILLGLLFSLSVFLASKLLFDKPQTITIETNNDMRFLNDTLAWHSNEIRALKIYYIKVLNKLDSIDNLIAK